MIRLFLEIRSDICELWRQTGEWLPVAPKTGLDGMG